MSDLVGNPEDWFSRVAAHLCKRKTPVFVEDSAFIVSSFLCQ